MNIGNKITITNPYTNEDEEYDIIGIDMYGSCTCKRGLNTFVLTREYLENFAINKKVKYMNIIDAVKLLQSNNDKPIKLMRRNKDYEIILDKVGIFLTATCVIDGRIYKDEPFTATINDILADDWYVVKNEKLHTFEEALKAYKSGKNIRRKGYHYEIYYDFDCEFDRDDVMANDWIIIDKEGKNA